MEKIECYKTNDGKLFTTYAEAIMYEKKEEIKGNLNKTLNNSIIANDLMKKFIDGSRLCSNLAEAQSLKRFLVNYMTEAMIKDYAAFKAIFDGELL
ncbi:hypothetical protein [Peptoniphilus duerdenii]|uniref:hypothetical protein n=1 Tax=Peptoniphilus duerdenii TaxID=507750 RepID=UPI0023F38F89|nr:hypothetical protein [Peptoniphilus duerdenii]